MAHFTWAFHRFSAGAILALWMATTLSVTGATSNVTGTRAVSPQTMGILLAGTHPWTNSAFDSLLPRALLPLSHRPLIWYGLAWLQREGIGEVAVCGNRETRLLKTRLERHVPSGLTVSYHEDQMPRGAAGSARDAASTSQADTFVVADATLIPNVDLHELLAKHHASAACVTVVVHPEATHNGRAARRAPSGIYVFSRRALESVPSRGFYDIKEELIPRLYAAGQRIVAYDATEETPRVIDSSTYMAANEWMIERLARGSDSRDGYVKVGDALMHRDAFVADDATLIGPILIESGVRVLSKAVVIGPTSIGREATIESGVVVSRSAVWRRSTIAEGAMADRCVVADDAIVAAGTHAFQTVVTPERTSELELDWFEAQAVVTAKEPVLGIGARIGRLVFGSPPRSVTAQ
jgi:NDP-sugar pyrophosphorylase family protein